MIRPQSENNIRNFNQPQVSPLTPQPPKSFNQKTHTTYNRTEKTRPKENMTNQDKDHFNESLLNLLNGQQGLKKQSLNMIQDITGRQEYDNLMRDIPINKRKNMDLADWLLQIEKVASLTQSQEYKLATAKSTNTPYKC